MEKDRVFGFILMVASLVVIAFYFYGLFLSDLSELIIKISLFAFILVLFTILAWIGVVLIVSPTPEALKEVRENIAQDPPQDEEFTQVN